jgi:hypothetical protein
MHPATLGLSPEKLGVQQVVGGQKQGVCETDLTTIVGAKIGCSGSVPFHPISKEILLAYEWFPKQKPGPKKGSKRKSVNLPPKLMREFINLAQRIGDEMVGSPKADVESEIERLQVLLKVHIALRFQGSITVGTG